MILTDRAEQNRRESLSTFVDSKGWSEILISAEENIIKPLREKALNNAALDPREHTGVVRALEAVRAVLYLPYQRLADYAGKPIDEYLPRAVSSLFE